MGTFTTTGIAAELAKFDGLMKGTDEACMKAVKAGGDVLAARLKETALVYTGIRRDITPGALRNSIMMAIELLKAAGVRVYGWGPDDYEQDTGIHHIAATCVWWQR